MLTRFSLYGFLKNQRYFEPFLVLAFLEKGISFFQIGLLIAFREVCINLMEIPSGAMADLYGRRRSMILSYIAYILSFILLGASDTYGLLFAAMFFFAIGDAFRTGTHKAMIFTWLRLQDRIDEKTKVYGYTRSWSKMGSAVSVVLATFFVIFTNNYDSIFYFTVIPYVLGLINFLGYPKALEGDPPPTVSLKDVLAHLWEILHRAIHVSTLRRLIIESMSFEGLFKAAKDYIQPILQATALAIPFLVGLEDKQRSAIILGAVYFALFLLSAFASRKAHRLTDFAGGDDRAARILWWIYLLIYGALVPLLYFKAYVLAIVCFVLLHLIQNFWRPILISRFDEYATEKKGATVLSVESQAKSISTMLIAPCMGYAVDFLCRLRDSGDYSHGVFWPVPALGMIVVLLVMLTIGNLQKAR